MTCEQSVVDEDGRGNIIADEAADMKTYKWNAKQSCLRVISCLWWDSNLQKFVFLLPPTPPTPPRFPSEKENTLHKDFIGGIGQRGRGASV